MGVSPCRQCLRKVGVVIGETARDVERGGPRVEPEGCVGGTPCAIGALLEKQLDDARVVLNRGDHERRDADHSHADVGAGPRGVVDVRAGVQEGDGDLGEPVVAGDLEGGEASVVDGVGGCERVHMDVQTG